MLANVPPAWVHHVRFKPSAARHEAPAVKLLTIETTCDETAAAVVTDQLEVLSSVVASQDQLHERFGGVVPEIASRAHVERILPVIDEALRKAGLTLADLDAVAVANTPGLAGSLLVGLTAAKTICAGLRLAAGGRSTICRPTFTPAGWPAAATCSPASAWSSAAATRTCTAVPARPISRPRRHDRRRGRRSVRQSRQHAGPAVSRRPVDRTDGRSGNPTKYRFPRPLLDDTDRLDFSFSGLKTAVRYQIFPPGKLDQRPSETAPPPLNPQEVADIAASLPGGRDRLPRRQSRTGPEKERLSAFSASAAAWRRTAGSAPLGSLGRRARLRALRAAALALHRQRRDGRDRRRTAPSRQVRRPVARHQPRPRTRLRHAADAANKKRGPKLCFGPRSIVLRPNCRKPRLRPPLLLPALATTLRRPPIQLAFSHVSPRPRQLELVALAIWTIRLASRPPCGWSESSAIRPNQFGPSS